MEWNFAEAKNRLSELVTRASKKGPQTVRCRNVVVVVIEESAYHALVGKTPTFKEYLFNAPSLKGVIMPRDKSPMRDANL